MRGPRFEARLERIEQIVDRLDQGELSLEESLSVFEEGVALSKQCWSELEAAEQRVEILVREGGAWSARPFDAADDADDRRAGRPGGRLSVDLQAYMAERAPLGRRRAGAPAAARRRGAGRAARRHAAPGLPGRQALPAAARHGGGRGRGRPGRGRAPHGGGGGARPHLLPGPRRSALHGRRFGAAGPAHGARRLRRGGGGARRRRAAVPCFRGACGRAGCARGLACGSRSTVALRAR